MNDAVSARRWIGPALLASLGINLFLIGMLSAPIFFRPLHKDMGRGPGAPMPFLNMLHRSVEALPPDDRAAVRKIMAQEFPQIRPYFSKVKEARLALATAIGTEPYDATKVKAAFDQVDASTSEMSKVMSDAMVEGFSKMTSEQRDRVAKLMLDDSVRRLDRAKQLDKDGAPGPDGSDGPPSGSEGAAPPPSQAPQ